MKKGLTFKKALERLEEIVALLEEPNIDVDQAVGLLEEGVSLHKFCREKLTKAQAKIDSIFKENQDEANDD